MLRLPPTPLLLHVKCFYCKQSLPPQHGKDIQISGGHILRLPPTPLLVHVKFFLSILNKAYHPNMVRVFQFLEGIF